MEGNMRNPLWLTLKNKTEQQKFKPTEQQDVDHHLTSYASIMNNDKQPTNDNQKLQSVGKLPIIQMEKQDEISIPDATTVILGKVKSLKFIENLHVFCHKEGFGNMDVIYMGASWVWTEFDNKNPCNRFKQRDDMKQYFFEIQNLYRQFVVDEKIVWTEIFGMPLGWWSNSAFKKVAKQ